MFDAKLKSTNNFMGNISAKNEIQINNKTGQIAETKLK